MIRIRTLGGLSILSAEGSAVAGAAAQPRRMAVLALLARAGERGIAREKMLTLLWPDADDERGPRTMAQALYALRKDLGSDDAITGQRELGLNASLVSSDVTEFAAAIARGDHERAATLYSGPFLDGFRLPGAEEFNRWVETERAALAQDHSRTLESLARAAFAAGRNTDAVTWWNRLAALDPLNARVAVGLMEALAAAGDRAGAIRHAHVYELLVQEELDLPADKQVTALAQRLRDESTTALAARVAKPAEVPSAPAVALEPDRAPESKQDDANISQRSARAPSRVSPRAIVGVSVAALGLAVVLVATLRVRGGSANSPPTNPSTAVAIGRIASYGTDSATTALTGAVSDLLATSLARLPGVRLVTHARMLELVRSTDTSAAALVDAARQAGASDVIDGVLYARPGGLLRLDLRRVDLSSGAVRDVHTVEGRDLFALVDSGTAQLSGGLGTLAPRGSVSDVTTRSVAAYTMYAEGVRAYYGGDNRSALRLFDHALAEDSLFALAAYHGALAASRAEPDTWIVRMDRARRLATRAPDRERLIITADWALRTSSPTLGPAADTLTQRYPNEVEGHLYSGIVRVLGGDFLQAIEPLERAVRLDSLRPRGTGSGCVTCEAFPWLVTAYESADSGAAAERVARRWLRVQAGSWPATQALLSVLGHLDRVQQADSILRGSIPTDAEYDVVLENRLALLLRARDYEGLDHLLHDELRGGTPRRQANAWWWTAYSLREQGRFKEALAAAHQLRRFPERGRGQGDVQQTSIMDALILLESGQAASAMALFDSIAHIGAPTMTASERARFVSWALVHRADAQAAAGRAEGLSGVADSIQSAAQSSVLARDRRLNHHVRGLLFASEGRDDDAIREFESALYSLPLGYTRTNYELARLYLRKGRARDAVHVLQGALRGGLDGSNLYMNRTQLHELLAQAWDSAGKTDSAVVHYAIVAGVWGKADAGTRVRAESARSRSAALQR
jgi:DNA-binding SARP family transcriptional activator